jgi:hypothetical protein
MRNIVNITFYGSLMSSFIFFLLPARITMGVYSPNAFGWFWLVVLIPVTLITFAWAGSQDVRSNNKKGLIIRVLIFTVVLLVSAGYWYLQANHAGNLK